MQPKGFKLEHPSAAANQVLEKVRFLEMHPILLISFDTVFE